MFIKIKVYPCCKTEEIIKKSEDSYEIKIKEKPEKGLANKAIISALAVYFGMPEKNIRIIKGFKERNKIIEIL